jgi:hypothetical protein
MLLPSTKQPMICARLSVLNRFIMTIMLEASDGASAGTANLSTMPRGAPSQEDVLLLIADGAEGPYNLDRIRLMKAAFLVDRKGPDSWDGMFAFRPYTYGPFDSDVYRARDHLMEQGFLLSVPGRYGTYRLTNKGKERVAEIETEIGDIAANWVRSIGRWVTRRSFSKLIQSIYAEYPDYAKHSALVHK